MVGVLIKCRAHTRAVCTRAATHACAVLDECAEFSPAEGCALRTTPFELLPLPQPNMARSLLSFGKT